MARTKGSSLDFSSERIDALMREYVRFTSSHPFIRGDELYAEIVNRPSPRFWVSEIRAAVIIGRLHRGDHNVLSGMHPSKREMYAEIYSRFLTMRPRYPRRSLSWIVSRIVYQQAPAFYLSPSSAEIMICKAKKKWFAKNLHPSWIPSQ
ncbi:MAG: hypothetical protein HDT02_02095 [Bacteroidales bacterium]|nr:hypothetical protein [Bacteroidales bacterium]